MLDFNLSTPQDIIDDKDKLRHILRTVRYPNQKTKRIHNLATLFLDDNFDIFEKIIEDSNNGREYEFEFSSTGEFRYKGMVRLLGKYLIDVEMEPYQFHE